MKRFVTLAFACTALVPLGIVASSAQSVARPVRGPQASTYVVVPDTSVPKSEDFGLRAHTNHLQYVGPDFRQTPFAFAQRGPALLTAFTSPAGYHPSDIRSAYNLPSTGGTGAIAIVDAYSYGTALKDFNYFASTFGLPQETSTSATSSSNAVFQVVYQGTRAPSANASWAQEEALDIEWAHSLAPNAKIYLVEANSASYTDLFAAAKKAATLPGVREVSMSFGGGEFSGETAYDSTFTATSGVVFFASAGDTGGVQEYPSESPNVVAVGGTSLHVSGGVVSGETAWSGSGGGPSSYEAIPSYQSSISSIVGSHRGAPDISLVADPNTGVSVYDSTPYGGSSGWLVFGGTSVASPCCAGIANLSGHALSSSSAELSRIYGELGSSYFRDITSGTAGSYSAKAGWDFVTGAGSPVGTTAL